jgi:hypothetical protein
MLSASVPRLSLHPVNARIEMDKRKTERNFDNLEKVLILIKFIKKCSPHTHHNFFKINRLVGL